jgi:hypothetical protein
MNIEPLETRIAPASVLTYVDIDGDRVTVTSTLGELAGRATIVGGQLRLLDLSAPSFDGTSITVSVVKAGAGDGLAAIGRINGGTNDFGAIAIKGDLGNIDAGSTTAGTPAIKSLSVRTMGAYGLATQGGAGDLTSTINGALGALKVAGDVKDANIDVLGAGSALGSVTIGGSLIGGVAGPSGSISSNGDIGAVKIGRDVQGSTGASSGRVFSLNGKIASVTLGGSLIGGSGVSSGQISSFTDIGPVKIGRDMVGGSGSSSGTIVANNGKIQGVTLGGSLIGGSGSSAGEIFSTTDMGVVKIGHNIQGGTGLESGTIRANGKLAGLTLGGSLIGGSNTRSGGILSFGDMGSVKIGDDVLGGAGTNSGAVNGRKIAGVTIGGSLIGGAGTSSGVIISQSDMGAVTISGDLKGASIATGLLEGSGSIQSLGRIARVTIGGSIIAGLDNSATGSLSFSATIRAANDIGAITVKGGLLGSVGSGGDITKVVISARGQEFLTSVSDVAIGKLSIGGRVERAQVLAGYDTNLTPLNGNAQIGVVAVGGDWVASDLVAGVQDGGAAGFGDAGDTIIPGGTIAKIASITIKGVVVGTAAGGDRFGFESRTIGSFKAAGVTIPLVSPVSLSPITADVTLRLV